MRKTSNASSSRQIHSGQSAPHDKLASTVARHLASPFRKPFAPHNLQAFDSARQWLAQQRKPLILDSFCGVGESTACLAQRHPDCAVIGVDKSAHRLARHGLAKADNYLLLRTDVDDFWRLAAQAGWRPLAHYLLYPNPWPKPGQLRYRVHGSAVFPALLALGGKVELRSNWQVYVTEFQQALTLAGHSATVAAFTPAPAITPFERKYADSGQTLWQCRADLRD